jgi:hypothetical protein
MDFNAIDRVGIELEGGWNTQPANAAYHHDGSVRTVSSPISGEQVSAPINNWAGVADWVTTAYPTESNVSCGLHVHASFKSRSDYAKLMSAEFYAYFLDRMKAWGERVHLPQTHAFWTRLNGFNRYCEKVFLPEQQVQTRFKTGVRYAQLNYCFRLHGTIECRLMPVFKQARIAVSAVQEILSCYEDFLRERQYSEVVLEVTDLA